jgi:acyl-CoA dehydrogenase
MWTFETDPEYQAKLDWADEFMRSRVEPLQLYAETLARHGR